MFVESVLPNDSLDMLNFLPAAGSNKATGQLLQSPNDSHNHFTFESPIKKRWRYWLLDSESSKQTQRKYEKLYILKSFKKQSWEDGGVVAVKDTSWL